MLFIASFRSADATSSPCVRALLSRFPAADVEGGTAGHLRPVRELALQPLSVDESVALVQSLSPQLAGAEAIANDAAGNPFFVAQLVHYVATTQGAGAGAGDELARHLETIRIPDHARAGPARAHAAVPLPALALLEVVSVAGRPIAPRPRVSAAEVLDADTR